MDITEKSDIIKKRIELRKRELYRLWNQTEIVQNEIKNLQYQLENQCFQHEWIREPTEESCEKSYYNVCKKCGKTD